MPILLLFAGLFLPRIAVILLAFFTSWFSTAFDNWIIPVLGFIFLPYALLWYNAVQNWFGGARGLWQVIFLAIALILDLSSPVAATRKS